MLMIQARCLPAEQTLEDALKYSPHNYQLLAAMGKLKSREKRLSRAIDYYKQAVEVVPDPRLRSWRLATCTN